MNKLFTKIATTFVGIAMAIGVGVAVGSHSDVRRADADSSFVVEFKDNGTGSDGSDQGASPTVSNIVKSGSTDYVKSFSSCSKLYLGKTGYGIKLGSGSATGTVNFTLADSYQSNIKSIKLVSAKYGSDTGTLTLYNGSTSLKSGIKPGTDYTHTFTSATTVESVKVVTSTKRAYILSLEFTVEGGGGGGGGKTITFKNNGSDGNTEFTATTLMNYVTSGASNISSFSNLSKAYPGAQGVKLGSSGAVGSFKINFKSNLSLNGSTLYATIQKYGSDTGKLQFASDAFSGTKSFTPTSSAAEIEVATLNTEPTYLTVSTSAKRGYILELRFDVASSFAVHFDMQNHGSAIEDQQVDADGKVTRPSPDPSATGYDFGGWYKEAACTNAWNFTTDTVSAETTIYAKWTATTYSINYVLNDGTHGSNHPTSGTYDTAFAVSAPTKTGHTFAGWTVTAGLNSTTAKWGTTNNPATAISSSDTLCVNGTSDVYFKNVNPSKTAVTLTANWTVNTYEVNGSITHGSLTVPGEIEYGGSLDVTIVPESNLYGVPQSQSDITVTGATISSYNSTTGVVGLSNPTGTVTVTAACVPLAQECTVTYNPNGGTVSPDFEEVVEGGHPEFPTPTRSGFNFKGWQVNGSGTAYFDPEDYTVSGDVTFVASWAAVYTVSFNSDGGSSTPASKEIENGSTFIFESAGTKAHHSFLGWSSDGGETKYAVGATSPAVTGNMTYTAQWEEGAYCTVTYSASSHGTGSFAHTHQYLGTYTLLAFNLLDGVSAESGYQFKDYTVNGQSKNPGDTFTLEEAITVTVNFEIAPTEETVAKTMSEIVSENGFTVSSGSNVTCYTEFSLDEMVTVSTSGTPNCGSFWGTSPDNDWRLYENRGGDVTIAVPTGCELEQVTITYTVSNTGALFDGSNQIESGTTYNVSGTSVTYTVDNTSAATNGQARIKSISVKYVITAPVASYTITYNRNGGTGEMPNTTGSAPHVATCTFTAPAGMEFSSWNDDPNGEGVEYQVDQVVTADVTLYAIWSESSGDVSEYFTKITSTSDIKNDGKYLIVYGDLCFDGSLDTLDKSVNTADASLSNLLTSYFTIDVSSGAIKSASNLYIGNESDSNALTTSDTPLSNTISFDEDGNLVVQSSGGAYLRYNKTSGQERFRYYKSSTYTSQQPIQLYKVNISKCILSDITCNSAGTSAPTGTWSNLVSYYNTLSSDDKAAFGEVIASESGTQVEQAMAKYDYIIGKYNPDKITDPTKTNFVHFITSRSPVKIGSGMIAINSIITNSTNTSIIVIVTVGIAAIAIGGYFLLRKKKED